ncbi:MAG: hypothetical protein PWP57_144 [Candidatus Atribacteria bacterium]|nr:hypothetical protein [Candidatus Atribacteria bacterium]
MQARREIVYETSKGYKKLSKKEKAERLDNLVAITGYNRDYASRLLSQSGRCIYVKDVSGRSYRLIGDARKNKKRSRKKKYDTEVFKVLKQIWAIMDYPCGKRLAPCMSWLIPKLEICGEIKIKGEVREKLLTISASTIDRLLKEEKKKIALRSRKSTKPGTLLKNQIEVRTFSDWNNTKVGFMEMDLVSHEGGNPRGDFAFSLTLTDIHCGWTENRAVKNRAQKWTREALDTIKARLPFPIKGLDSDNDSTFINYHMLRYCEENHITFTRSRAGNKNDGCYVEQKNWSIVRRTVGYARYDTEEEVDILNQIYDVLRLYVNMFQPVAKLISKERQGAKVKKIYDTPKTPCQRLLESPDIPEEVKAQLQKTFDELNPAALKREIDRLLRKLTKAYFQKKESLEQIDRELIFT